MSDGDGASAQRARNLGAIVVALAVLAGGAARIGTAEWGLPFSLHADERGFVMHEAAQTEWRGLATGDWRPRSSSYGPVVYGLALAVKWIAVAGPEEAGRAAAAYDGPSEYVLGAFAYGCDEGQVPWSSWLRALRLTSAVLSTLAILFFGLAAWRFEGPATGAITAILAAACVGLIQVGHFYTSDALLLFELSLLAHAVAGLSRGKGLWTAVWCGILLAAIAATKAPGLTAAVAIPLAIGADDPFPIGRTRQEEIGRMLRRTTLAIVSLRSLVAAAVAVLVLRGLNPWLFTSWSTYFNDVPRNQSGPWLAEYDVTRTEFDFYEWQFPFNDTPAYLYHLDHTLPYALGWPLLVVGLLGLSIGVVRLKPIDRIALALAVPTFLLVGGWGAKTIRYILPSLPGLLLAAGALVARWGAVRSRAPARGVVRRLAIWAVVGWTILYAVAFTSMFAEPDSRVEAARYVAEHAEAGDVVVVGPDPSYTAPLGSNDALVGCDPELSPEVTIEYLWQGQPRGRPALRSHLDQQLRGARFLVVDDFHLRRATHPSAIWRAPDHHAFYRALIAGETGFERVRAFRREPAIGALRWDESDAEILAVSFDHVGVEVWERTSEFVNPLVDDDDETAPPSQSPRLVPLHHQRDDELRRDQPPERP